MAKSVLELAVGTGQWDAGLKKAKSALDNFTQANGGLQQALDKESQKMQKFVQMMGGMESTAKTAKGQMNDYKSTIEQLTMQYNRMTEAQKKVIGQDYLQAIDQMKQKYQSVNEEIQEMNRSLNNVKLPDMKDGGGGLFSGMGDKMSGAIQVFAGNMMTKAAGAVATLGSEIEDMVKQGVELAKQGEGIRIAFERLGRGDILDGLRQATHGTVTDLELMKAAVKFNDFKLPVEELGTMLAFAQQKAKDTGQSVDYMVDSIVTGLGRKSLMILDNLGLSANEVKEKMAETGDMTKAVGAIIREQMSKAGDYVETAADRAAQANVSLQNKMEELGRKFAPVEEASSQLWTSMKIGILDIIGGPLATLLNQLTEAGRLKNMLNSMNGEPGSGNTKVDQQVKKLNVIKKGGGSDYIFNSTLNGMLEDYNRQIAALDAKIKETKKLSPDQQASKFVRDEVQKMSEQMKALGMMRDQLAAGAKELSKPVDVKIETKGAEQNVDSLNVKLIELEAQRKKAIAAGDTDLSKNLAKQISQVKSDIKGLVGSTTNKTTTKTVKTEEQLNNEDIQKLTQEYIKASDDRRKAIEGEIKTLQDRNKEITRLKDMALGKIGDDGSLSAMSHQLKELQSAQSESASGREWDDYQKKIDDVTSKINVLKGVLPKDQQATFTVTVNAEQLEQLRMLLPSDEETVRINVEEGRIDLPDIPTEIEQVVNTKVGDVVTPEIATDIVQTINTRLGSIVTPDIAETLTQVINTKVGDVVTPEIAKELTQVINIEPGTVDLPEIQKEDETIRVNITATTEDAMKEVRDMVGEIEGWEVAIEPKIEIKEEDLRTPFEKLRDSLKIEIAEENMQVDTTTLQTLMKTAIQNGIDGLYPDFSTLQEKMREGMNIPDETWQALQDEINEKLKELGIEPIKIDFKTGNLAKDGKETEKSWQAAAQAVQTVGSAMSSIEDPAAKIAGTVAQAIATIALGYANAMKTAGELGPVAWIAFAATGLATMLSTISSIHSATGYANGGIVKGNSYSGDNIPAMIDGGAGGFAGLNAGEIVLNKAAQGNLASQLQGAGMGGMQVIGEISGEKIVLVANRFFKRTGQGEIVTW